MSATPLSGVRVIDLTRHLPGPLVAHGLSDLGARVIKVEEPRLGDPVRFTPPRVAGQSALAALLLAGVESIALDLRQALARDTLLALLAEADVLLESFRPGTLARFGVAPTDLRQQFPRLVIASISGWGQDGPYAARAGHDLTYQAAAGSLAATGTMPAVPVADLAGAWSAATAVLAALYERERTGAGTWIDASLFEGAIHANLVSWAMAAGGSHEAPIGERQMLSGALPCYNLYRTLDGRLLALAPLEEHFWQRFLAAARREDLAPLQYRQDAAARRQVADVVALHTASEWMNLLSDRDVPAAPVAGMKEAAEHPQACHRGLLSRGPEGLYRLAFPARFDGQRPPVAMVVPELGEATDRVLTELGGAVAATSARARRLGGVGRRPSLRRWLARWLFRRSG